MYKPITDLAQIALDALEGKTRPDGTRYLAFKQDAPDWTRDLAYAAHGNGNILPDDFRYDTLRDVLEEIVGGETDVFEIAEHIGPDTYNHALLEWLGSHGSRRGYCDEALSELGEDVGGIMDIIAFGQIIEIREVADLVLSFLSDQADEIEDEDEDNEAEDPTE